MIEIQFNIGKSDSKTPQGKIILNNQIVFEGAYKMDKFEIQPRIGDNQLTITLENKSDRDTKLQGNQIIEDVYVVVKDIKCLVTGDSAGHLDTIGDYKTDAKENLKTYGYLSYNGEYTFNFQYPFYIFQKNKIFYQ